MLARLTIIFAILVSPTASTSQAYENCSKINPLNSDLTVESADCTRRILKELDVNNCTSIDISENGSVAKLLRCTALLVWEFDKTRSNFAKSEANVKRLDAKLIDLMSESSSLQEERDDLREEVEALKAKSLALEKKEAELNRKLQIELRGKKSAELAQDRLTTQLEKLATDLDESRASADALAADKKNLETRISNAGIVAWHTFSTGEYDRGALFRPRHYCYHNVKAEAKNLCGGATPIVKLLSDRAGDKCGYAEYVVACLVK